jgi:hypothetical protein
LLLLWQQGLGERALLSQLLQVKPGCHATYWFHFHLNPVQEAVLKIEPMAALKVRQHHPDVSRLCCSHEQSRSNAGTSAVPSCWSTPIAPRTYSRPICN